MDREFSAPDPKARMKVITKCERVQPFMTGVDANGEPIWEGREMPRWQMELLRVTVDWFGPLFTRWCELVKYEGNREEFNDTGSILTHWLASTKQRIEDMKRQYPAKVRATRRHHGD